MSPGADAGGAPPAAAAQPAAPKTNPRRKKGAATAGQSEQRVAEGKPRSASVPALLPLGESVGGAQDSKSGGDTAARPPRSPVKDKQTKACVPTLQDALDDVQVRFVLNLPEAELSSADRLFFQLEQAWWFYEDFIADAHKHLPHFRLKEFAKLMFQHCEALRPLSGKYNELFERFKSWKGTIPTAGCILLNTGMTKVVLVKCWKGNSRGLPKGKINQGEPSIAAALREVMEETGYDASGGASEKDCLTLYLNGQQTTMYIVTGVDEEYPFAPQVRKEISAVEWFPLDALPKGCYGVEPFMQRLRRWMAKSKGMRAPKDATADARTQSLIRVRKGRATSPDVSSAAAAAVATTQSQPSSPTGASATNGNAGSKKQGRKGGKGAGARDPMSAKGEHGRACSAPNRRGPIKGCDVHNRDTFGGQDQSTGGGGGGGGGEEGWDFEAMLAANERLTGRTFVYDGNPHEFGDPAHTAQTGATPASVSSHATGQTRAREEDQVGHLKQRNGGDEREGSDKVRRRGNDRNRTRGKGGRAAASDGDGGGGVPVMSVADAAADGMVSGDGSDGSRIRSKGHRTAATANANASASKPKANKNNSTHDRAARRHCGGGAGAGDACAVAMTVGGVNAGPSMLATGEGTGCPQAASSSCTEEVGGRADGAGVAMMWGTGPAAGAGLFGEFKFDMLDIMSAVPQG